MRSPTKQNLFLIEFSHQFPSSSHQLLLTGKRQAININLVSSPAQFVGTDDAILRSKNTIQLGHGFYNNNVYKVIIHKVHFGQNIFGWRGLDQGWPCGCGSMRFMRMMRICESMRIDAHVKILMRISRIQRQKKIIIPCLISPSIYAVMHVLDLDLAVEWASHQCE